MEERVRGIVISFQQWSSKPSFGLVTSNQQTLLQCFFCERLHLEDDSVTKSEQNHAWNSSVSESPSATTQLPLLAHTSMTWPCFGQRVSLTVLHLHGLSMWQCLECSDTTSSCITSLCTSCWGTSLVAQMVKTLPAVVETQVWSLGWEDTLEKEMATHSSILAWRIPWTEEPGGL